MRFVDDWVVHRKTRVEAAQTLRDAKNHSGGFTQIKQRSTTLSGD